MDLRLQSTKIAERKLAVLAFLPAEERATVRGQGSEYAKTWEDFARARSDGESVGSGWTEAYQIGRALAAYQEALNELYLWAYEKNKHLDAVRIWAVKQRPRLERWKLEEAEAEAIFLLRKVCATQRVDLAAAYGAQAAELERMFDQYLRRVVLRGLDEWLVRSESVVEVPQKAVARKGRRAVPLTVSDDVLSSVEEQHVGEDR